MALEREKSVKKPLVEVCSKLKEHGGVVARVHGGCGVEGNQKR